MGTVLLPPGGNPIADNKYIISYHIYYKNHLILCWDTKMLCEKKLEFQNVKPGDMYSNPKELND